MQRKSLVLLALSGLVFAPSAHAQKGAPEDSTIKDTANSVTEPFDGKEVPEKLLAIQDRTSIV